MEYGCVGFLEISTIAKGIQVVDALVKKASVELVLAYPFSSGRYLICFHGEVEDTKSAFIAGKHAADKSLIDSCLLPKIHSEVLSVLREQPKIQEMEALGILETLTCSSCILAADKSLKTSKVKLIKIHLGKGIGGKAYFVIEGEVEDVNSALLESVRVLNGQGIIEKILIPQADPKLLGLFGS